MRKNKFLTMLIILAMTFTTVFSLSVSYAAVTEEQMKAYKEKLGEANPFEMAISEMCLSVGDFVMEYLTFLLKEEVTIERIIFNDVDALNANFFENSLNASEAPATKYIREAVNAWYNLLGQLVILIYLIALVAVGIMIMLGGVERKAKAQDILIKWTIGLAIFYLFPYVMRYAFDLNEAVIKAIQRVYMGDNGHIESYIGSISDLRYDDLEERSPQYVTRTTYILTLGSEEATAAYINRLETYKSKGDVMRIMRSLAGITARMIYVILWFIMLAQLLVFLFIYYKRYLMIAFLIAIFPITLVEYVIGTISTGKQTAISSWSREFFTNVFLQTIHAIIYGIIAGVIMSQVRDMISNGTELQINWFLMICAISFVFTGERILKEIMNAGSAESVKSAGDVANSARGGIRNVGGHVKGAGNKVAGWMKKD